MRGDPTLPLVFTRDEALDAGMSRHQIAQRVRTGGWRPLRRAHYIETRRYAALTARERHLAALVATLMARPESGSASHLSAAAAYGWVLPLAGPGPVTLTSGDLDATTRRAHLRGLEQDLSVQVASLPDSDARIRSVSIAGTRWDVRLTSRARTVADNLRHLPNADGVALADSALRASGSGRSAGGRSESGAAGTFYEQIAAVLNRQGCWPYSENARRALPLVDPRRESWLESFSFLTLHQMGLPMPEPQVSLFDARGHFVGRVDGWIENEAVALEADGRGKYFLDELPLSDDVDLAAGELLDAAKRRMLREKERRDRIVDLGAELVRWGTPEIVRSPAEVLARILAARNRGDAGRFRGRTAYLPAPAWLLPNQRQAG